MVLGSHDSWIDKPSKYSSAPALKVLCMSSKAIHIVGDIAFAANVQLSMISNTSL